MGGALDEESTVFRVLSGQFTSNLSLLFSLKFLSFSESDLLSPSAISMIHHPVYFYGDTTSMDLRKDATVYSMQRIQRLQLLKVATPEHNRYGQFKKRITK